MSRWLVAAGLVPLLAALGAACSKDARGHDEGQRTKEAFEKFIDFGMSNESYDLGKQERRGPPAKVRSRAINNTMTPRMRLEVDVELAYDLTGRDLELAMLDSARAAIAGSDCQAVRVRAWPGPLKRFGGIMGYAVVALDGQGWDGERMGYREAKVMLVDSVPKPNALDYRILCALEKETATLAAPIGIKAAEAAKKKGAPKDAALRAQAMQNVAKGLGLQVEAVQGAVRKAEGYYLKE